MSERTETGATEMQDDFLIRWLTANPGKTYWDCVAEIAAERQQWDAFKRAFGIFD